MSSTNSSQGPFEYNPSIPAASIFLGLFAISTVIHIYQIVGSKTWYLGAIIACGIFEVVGYSTRLAAIQDPSSTEIYSVQYAFIVLAPIFLAASVYVMLSRIIVNVDHPALIPARRITVIFVGCDILAFLVQVAGAIILLNTKNAANQTNGKNVLLAGLGIQIITFAFFISIAIHFNIAVAKSGRNQGKWRWLMKALYVACGLIWARSIFRVIEFSQDSTSYLQTNEWPFYVFDAVLIFFAMIIFNAVHPGQYLLSDLTTPTKNSPAKNPIGENQTPEVMPPDNHF